MAERDIQQGSGKKRLFRLVHDNSDSLKFNEVEPRQSSFDSSHVFIFDIGHQVYTWVGRNAMGADKAAGLHYAQKYILHSKLPAFTPITRVIEGGEDELFESSLEGWQGW